MLTVEQKEYIVSSVGNYIEVGHAVEVQPYFDPIIKAIDSGKYQRIAISSPHSVGKTFMMGRIVDAIMGSFNNVKLVSTAPSHRQVHDLLWKEIADAYSTKPNELRRGRLNEVALWINPKTYAQGFSPQKRARSEVGQGTDSVFQGYHGEYMTVVIFDEATGIEHQIWTQAEGLLTQGRVLFIAIGNPTSRNCEFFKCFQSRAWKTFKISCFDSPNLKANGIHTVEDIQKEADYVRSLDDEDALERLASYKTPVPYILNTRWVIEKAIHWSIDHPLFKGKVLGEFPDTSTDVIATEEEVKRSQERDECDLLEETRGYLGLDVARFGVDKSVLTSMIGDQQLTRKSMSKNDTNQVVGHTINYIEDLQGKHEDIEQWRICIDGGFGHGVIDRLRELKEDEEDERVSNILKSVEILEINFGSSDWVLFHYGWVDEFTRRKKEDDRLVQEDRENYANFKAKMFDLLSIDIKKNLKLSDDNVYVDQLPTIYKQVDSKGRLKIESKEDYKERTGETSPDEADSLALCNFGRYFASQVSILDLFKK
jgi:hypothetical protein